jgi:hypothetical protein
MRSLMSVYAATFAFRLVNASQIVRRPVLYGLDGTVLWFDSFEPHTTL